MMIELRRLRYLVALGMRLFDRGQSGVNLTAAPGA
jgi:hypothetical protein